MRRLLLAIAVMVIGPTVAQIKPLKGGIESLNLIGTSSATENSVCFNGWFLTRDEVKIEVHFMATTHEINKAAIKPISGGIPEYAYADASVDATKFEPSLTIKRLYYTPAWIKQAVEQGLIPSGTAPTPLDVNITIFPGDTPNPKHFGPRIIGHLDQIECPPPKAQNPQTTTGILPPPTPQTFTAAQRCAPFRIHLEEEAPKFGGVDPATSECLYTTCLAWWSSHPNVNPDYDYPNQHPSYSACAK
jgi:hypothetical protein